MTTLNDDVNKLIIGDKDIDNYFASRDNEEHFKVKKPSFMQAIISEGLETPGIYGKSIPSSKIKSVKSLLNPGDTPK